MNCCHIKCLELAAAFEMGRRWSRITPDELRSKKVTNPNVADEVFKTVLTPGDNKENLYALLLSNKNCPICEPLRISRGMAWQSAAEYAKRKIVRSLHTYR